MFFYQLKPNYSKEKMYYLLDTPSIPFSFKWYIAHVSFATVTHFVIEERPVNTIEVKRVKMDSSDDSDSDSSVLPQKILEYAEAGFKYDGLTFTCIYCDGVIEFHYKGEDPWELHALLFSDCEYLRKEKGQDYIREILSKYTTRQKSTNKKVLDESINQMKCLLMAYKEYTAAAGITCKEYVPGTLNQIDILPRFEREVNEFISGIDRPRLKSRHFYNCYNPDCDWYPPDCDCFKDPIDYTKPVILDKIGVEIITWLYLKKSGDGI